MVAVNLGLSLLALLGGGLRLATWLGQPVAIGLPVAAALGVAALLAGALAGVLEPMRWALIVAGLLSLTWETWRGLRLPEPALAVWVAALVALYVLTAPLHLIFWDEFSHWATFPRFLIETGELPRRLGDIIFLEYPPAWGVFAFLLLGRAFDEGALLFAAAALQVTLMLPLLAALRWREAWVWLPLVVALTLMPSAFGMDYHGWTAISVDATTPLAAAAGMAIYLLAGRGRQGVVLAAPLLALAVLLKGSGTPMVAAVGMALLLDLAWLNRALGWRAGIVAVARAGWPAAVVPLIALLAWSAHVSSISSTRIWDTSWATVSARIAEAAFADYAANIQQSFFRAAASMNFSNIKLSLGGWAIVFAGLAASAALVRREVVPVLLTHAALLLGFLLYAGLLLVYYLVAFVPYEAVRLAGMNRYLSSYLQLWLTVGFVLVLVAFGAAAGWRRWAGAALVLAWSVALPLGLGADGVRTALAPPRATTFAAAIERDRALVAEAARAVRDVVPARGAVYVLWNATTGFEYYATMFELKPRRTSTPQFIAMHGLQRMHDAELWCHSLGPGRFEGDVWSCPWTPERLVGALEGWDYLLVGALDQPFLDSFASLLPSGLEPGPFALFRVERSTGAVRLMPIPGG